MRSIRVRSGAIINRICGAFVGAAVVLCVSCSAMPFSNGDLSRYLPRETDLPGWREVPAPLRENEAALLGDGVRRSAAVGFVSYADERLSVRVELYAMSGPLGAFGAFSRERGFDQTAEIGLSAWDDAAVRGDVLLCRRGAYFLRIVCTQCRGGIGREGAVFADIVAGALPRESGPLPDYLTLFGADASRRGIVYFATPNEGMPDIGGFFMREKQFPGGRRRIFYSRKSSYAESLRIFSGLLVEKGNPFILRSTGSMLQTAFRKTTGGGYVCAALYDEWLFGVADAAGLAEGDEIIASMHGDIVRWTL